MSVVVEAIKFNHDPVSATNDALNIRRNASQFLAVPEWQRGVSVNPEDSRAAYAKSETKGNTITIQVQLRRLRPAIRRVQVRAIDASADPPERPGCLGVILRIISQIVRALFGNVLGEVKPRFVTFQPTGLTNFESFELKNPRIADAGVGVYTTTWRWQYRRGASGPWIDIGTSTHRVYVLLAVPSSPWQQAPYAATNVQLPWTDVLDYACNWAFLAADVNDAAAKVTGKVYGLGPSVVTYDCPGGGSTHYALGAFDCTSFIERLNGGVGNGQYVNCTDCATIVSTFANALGCDLWQSRMGWGFDLNELLAIGSTVWETACGWGGFSYHEVAWKGGCTENDNVFDACLQVDGDADPVAAPHVPLLPTDLRFGNPGDGVYRDRLCPPTPSGRAACQPQPTTRKRRMIA